MTTATADDLLAQIGESIDGITKIVLEERANREALERKFNEARVTGTLRPTTTEAPAPTWRDAKTGAPVPVLGREHKLADLEPKGEKLPSLGRLLRGLALGSKADDARELAEERKALSIDVDAGGGILVPSALSARLIDNMRAQMVLGAAGISVVPMGSKELTIARVQSDPVVSWRGENASLAASDPIFGAVTLHAKTAAVLIKCSLELMQDAQNLERILETTLTGAMAGAIDRAGLVGSTTDAAAAPSGLFELAGRGTVTGVGAPTNYDHVLDALHVLETANVPTADIGGIVGHPTYWRKLRKLKTGLTSDQTTLLPPPDVARLPRFSTTAAPLAGSTAKVVLGRWADYLMGVRKDITLKVLPETFLGSTLSVGILAYARVDFGAARPASFCTVEGVTVS